MNRDGARPFFEALADRCEQAVGRGPVATWDGRVAGCHVRVQVAGARLAEVLLPALGEGEPALGQASPRLSFVAVDAAACGVHPPRPPWQEADYLERDEIRGSGRDGIDAACSVRHGVLSMFDAATGRGLWWAPDAGALPVWEPAAPLRNLFGWGLASVGVQLAHAAAVGTPDGGALLAGPGGSGKSTTAMACLAAGWRFAGDDYCALSAPPSRAHRVFSAAKLDGRGLRLVPGAARSVRADVDANPKSVLDLRGWPGLVDSLALTLVVIPRRRGPGFTQILPARATDAGRALVPSTVLQLPGSGPRTAARLGAAVAGLPVVHLVLGDDGRVTDVLGEAIAAAAGVLATGAR